jgi:hypothetical protein
MRWSAARCCDAERPLLLLLMPLRGGPVPFQIAVHDGEEHLEEEVDRIYDDGKQV